MAPARKHNPMEFVDAEKARRQARLNKQRADKMERDVAAYLNRGRQRIARRTPQSGAGWIKGDNHVPLPSPPDFFLISCKMSQAQTSDNRPYIPFSTRWVSEMQKDVNAMKSIGCKFGIIVVRWFGRASGEFIALVLKDDIPVISNYLDLKFEHKDLIIDRATKKDGSPLLSSRLFRADAISNVGATFKVAAGDLIILNLSTIHEALINADKLYFSEGGAL